KVKPHFQGPNLTDFPFGGNLNKNHTPRPRPSPSLPPQMGKQARQISAAVLSPQAALARRIGTLLETGGIEVVAEGRQAGELEEPLDQRPADVVVIACTSPSTDAKRAILDLRRRFPETPVVAVARDAESSRVARTALEMNVQGVVYRASISEALVHTVRAVSVKQVVIPHS